MRTSEVLAPPSPPAHPVRRALLMGLALALVGWAVVARLSGGDPAPPAARPPVSAPYAVPTAPPPWGTQPRGQDDRPAESIYRSTPLDGHWVSVRLDRRAAHLIAGTHAGERLTLSFRSTALAVWAGSRREPERRLLGYEAVYVDGHRVQLSPVGGPGKALYRWRIRGDLLGFQLLTRTPGASASARLVTVPFDRSLWS